MTKEQLAKTIVGELDDYARYYNQYEYGLPMHNEHGSATETIVLQNIHLFLEQELTAEREKAAKLVNSLEMALQILEENQKERHPFSIRMIRQSLTEYKKQ